VGSGLEKKNASFDRTTANRMAIPSDVVCFSRLHIEVSQPLEM
jgi:hypothetical protein